MDAAGVADGRRRLQGIAALGLDLPPQLHGPADAQPLSLAGHQPLDGVNVMLRVEAMAAAAALGRGQAVAPLPGPQRVGLEARLLDDGLQVEEVVLLYLVSSLLNASMVLDPFVIGARLTSLRALTATKPTAPGPMWVPMTGVTSADRGGSSAGKRCLALRPSASASVRGVGVDHAPVPQAVPVLLISSRSSRLGSWLRCALAPSRIPRRSS